MNSTDKRLFLLDAYALIFRGYYAFIKNPRVNSKGLDTSAIFGFTNQLLDLLKRENPTHLAVVFDVGKATVRTDYFEAYKANRQETPEAIRVAVPYIHEILKALSIPILFAEGYEADDVIGTLAQKAEKEGYTTFMVTPDKDFAQLVTDNIKIYRPASNGKGVEIWGIDEVKEKFEVEYPMQVVDFLGMMGDAIDNIPGLPGVGEKTAKKFIREYGSLENLLANTHEIKGKIREKIEENKELGLMSKRLATILTDAPVEFNEEDTLMCEPDLEKTKEIFHELEFRRLLENLYRTYGLEQQVVEAAKTETAQKTTAKDSSQMSLFDVFHSGDNGAEEPVTSFYKDIKTYDHLYQLVEGGMGRKLLLDKLLAQKEVCFDTETTGLDALNAELVGISFSYEKGKGYYVSFPEEFDQAKTLIEEFKPFFEAENIVKIGHNLKYDLKVLFKYGIEIKAPLFDTMIAHYLINPDMRHNMDLLSETYLNYQPVSIETLIGKKGKNQKSFRDVPLELQTEYAVEDADVTYQLKGLFEPDLVKTGTEKLFKDLEMPLMQVLAEMEAEGIRLDVGFLNDLSKVQTVQLAELENKIYQDADEQFNLNSPKQLGDILFEKLNLDSKAKKTKTGQYATSEDILVKLKDKHPIITDILAYRQLQKLKSTYVDALPNEVDSKTLRVHTTFAQTVAATGRLASVGPNLQNIPIRTEAGQQVRKAFIARDNEHVLMSADYSQIELRLIAQMSGDPIMTESFKNGEDIHRSTAARVFNVALEDVTREQRSHAKTVNFGIIYGVSAFGLSEQTGLSRSESKELIDIYYQTYPTLKKYMENQISLAREKGYVETLMGRRRYLKDINSRNAVVRGHAERNAVNAPIQGTAADIIKLAMIRIQKVLKRDFQTKMLLQVHDELVFDVPRTEVEEVTPVIKTIMESAMQMDVPLVVETGFGNNWLEAH